jgi:hypothetical protein
VLGSQDPGRGSTTGVCCSATGRHSSVYCAALPSKTHGRFGSPSIRQLQRLSSSIILAIDCWLVRTASTDSLTDVCPSLHRCFCVVCLALNRRLPVKVDSLSDSRTNPKPQQQPLQAGVLSKRLHLHCAETRLITTSSGNCSFAKRSFVVDCAEWARNC